MRLILLVVFSVLIVGCEKMVKDQALNVEIEPQLVSEFGEIPVNVSSDLSHKDLASSLGISLSGTGNYISSPFDLLQGVMLLHATHDGTRNFAVNLLPQDDECLEGSELSISKLGAYDGTRGHAVDAQSFVGLKTGLHRLDISADGNWKIDIEQDSWNQGDLIPLSVSGIGDGVIGPIVLTAGMIPIKSTYEGTGDFSVHILSIDGKNQEMLVSEIGSYVGSTTIPVKEDSVIGLTDGLHLVVVTADGGWKIDIGV